MNYKTIIVGSNVSGIFCDVGRQGEHDVTTVLLDCGEIESAFGAGTLTVMFTPPSSNEAFPVAIEQLRDNVYEWIVKENITSKCGVGFATFRWNLNRGGLAKAIPIAIRIERTYDSNVVEPPTNFDDWIEQLESVIRQAEYDVDPIHIANLIELYFAEHPVDAYTKFQSDNKFQAKGSYLKSSDGYKLPLSSEIFQCTPSMIIAAIKDGRAICVKVHDDTYGDITFNSAMLVNNDTICFMFGVGNYQNQPTLFTIAGFYMGSDINYWDALKISVLPNKYELDKFMQYFKITYSGGKLRDGNGYILLYDDIRRLFEDQSIFLYLDMDNLVYIPSIDVDDYMPGAIAFSVDWTRSENVGANETYDQPYVSRLIINSSNEIKTTQIGLQSTELMTNDITGEDEDWGAWADKMYPTVSAVRNYVKPLEQSIGSISEQVKNIYSAVPVKCGEWFGKEIRRRVYVVNSGIAKGNVIKVADKPTDMDLLIRGFGISIGSASVKRTMTNSDITVYVSDDGVFTVNNFTGYAERMYVVIEYSTNA